jgi:hypothetical protein
LLFAYYVPANGPIAGADLRRHLQEHLPPYMIPQAFTAIPTLPLTVNGKLDERALPEPQEGASGNGQQRAPRNGLEQQVLDMWRIALADERLGPDDNVFERGAHSLIAVQARNQLQTLLQREIPVVLLFEYPTPAALAMQLERGDSTELDHGDARRRASMRRKARQRSGG